MHLLRELRRRIGESAAPQGLTASGSYGTVVFPVLYPVPVAIILGLGIAA
ncbi:hypothetical protein [Nocardia otitidiscaviarum]|nr:hypothetical protein [Nocardia otitidiscaviarum]MBF6235976.1 hypothetical protein [Nocardia otitidiscaviarum]